MGQTNRARRRPHGTTLRVGELATAMALAAGAGLAVGLVATAVDTAWLQPPPVELGTVESARVLLGALTGGLITVAVFSLWMRTVVVGFMAAHFSPRTLLIFLNDRFQRNLLAFMSAGFVAVLVILLRLPSDEQAATPLVSTVLAVLIALAALAGVLLAIQHATRSLALPELISRLADDALEVLDNYPRPRVELTEVPPPGSASKTVMAPASGWVTGIDIDRMRKALPAGGVVHLRCRVGVFLTPRCPVALVSLSEAEGDADIDFDAIAEAVANAVVLARTRSPDQDLVFAVSQLVDVGTFALQERADTPTAHEVLVQLGAVLEEVIDRGLSRLHDEDEDGRRIYDEVGWDAADLVQLCVERLRGPASRDPEAARHLMRMLRRVGDIAEDCKDVAVVSEDGHQVEMLLSLVDAYGILPRDRQQLEREVEAAVDVD